MNLQRLASCLLMATVWGSSLVPRLAAQTAQEDPSDATNHAVARLSLLGGSVSTVRGDSGDFTNSVLNEPLVTGDRVITGADGSAELQFDSANILRAAAHSEVRMGDLQYHRYLIQIAQGTVTFTMLRESDSQVEISLPTSSFRPLRQGTYRVSVRADGSSEVTVRAGEAEVFSPTGSERLQTGTTMLARGSANDPEFMTVTAAQPDDWDRWNNDRDRSLERLADTSRRFNAEVSADITGAEDLSNYGRWTQDADYGTVWVPNVAADWTPYRDGRWTYVDYYGWSWVSYDAWGWAPYHYGRWYHGRSGWAWYPGNAGSAPHPYWKPALVAFVGWGSPGFGSSLEFGFGNVGWVPLAPREPFRAWYGRGYANGFNSTFSNNRITVVNVYQNSRYGAVTGIGVGNFGRSNRYVRPSYDDVTRAGLVGSPNSSWRVRPQNNGGNAQNSGVASRVEPRARIVDDARFYRSSQSDGNTWRRFNGGQPQGVNPQTLQINPPIVNDRSPNRTSWPGGGNGGQTAGAGRPPDQPSQTGGNNGRNSDNRNNDNRNNDNRNTDGFRPLNGLTGDGFGGPRARYGNRVERPVMNQQPNNAQPNNPQPNSQGNRPGGPTRGPQAGGQPQAAPPPPPQDHGGDQRPRRERH